MDNNMLNTEEVKCIKKMFKLASLAKYSLIAVCINFLPCLLLIVTDFIRFENNVSRDGLFIYLYAIICIIVILLIIWAIYYIILRRNLLNNKTWQNILEKINNGNELNSEVEGINSNIKSIIPVYLAGNLASLSKKLKEVGNTIKTISGIAVIVLIIKSCSLIVNFIKNISQAYNISLKSNSKLYFILFVLPAFIVVIINITTTINDVRKGNELRNSIIDSLKSNCEQSSYCDSINSFGEEITIRFDESLNVYSNLKLNEYKKVEKISVYFDYDKNMLKEDIISDANEKLNKLFNLTSSSNVKCANDFLCKKFQLSDNFVNKFYDMTDDNLGVENNVSYEYKLENKYTVNTYAYIKSDEYSNPTDRISLHFIIGY